MCTPEEVRGRRAAEDVQQMRSLGGNVQESTTVLEVSVSRLDGELEASLVELILAATECSEDEYEVADLVDAALLRAMGLKDDGAATDRGIQTTV